MKTVANKMIWTMLLIVVLMAATVAPLCFAEESAAEKYVVTYKDWASDKVLGFETVTAGEKPSMIVEGKQRQLQNLIELSCNSFTAVSESDFDFTVPKYTNPAFVNWKLDTNAPVIAYYSSVDNEPIESGDRPNWEFFTQGVSVSRSVTSSRNYSVGVSTTVGVRQNVVGAYERFKKITLTDYTYGGLKNVGYRPIGSNFDEFGTVTVNSALPSSSSFSLSLCFSKTRSNYDQYTLLSELENRDFHFDLFLGQSKSGTALDTVVFATQTPVIDRNLTIYLEPLGSVVVPPAVDPDPVPEEPWTLSDQWTAFKNGDLKGAFTNGWQFPTLFGSIGAAVVVLIVIFGLFVAINARSNRVYQEIRYRNRR